MKNTLPILILLSNILYGERFKVFIPHYEIENNQLKIDNFGYITETNKPRLPAKSIFILLPPHSEIKDLKIIKGSSIILPDTYTIEYTKPKLVEGVDTLYSTETEVETYPDSIIKFIKMEKFGNYRIAEFMVCPFVYNLKDKKLTFYNKITIDINYAEENAIPANAEFDTLLKDNVINFDNKSKWYYEDTIGYNYIIIVDEKLANNTPLTNTLKEFVYWKENIGYKVKVINDKEELKNFSPKYVMIIGDSIKNCGAIVGEIPYKDVYIISDILEKTIEFELNKDKKSILFVKGVSNYENENYSNLPKEEKTTLLNKLKAEVRKDFWQYKEWESKEIFTNYSIINFLSCGKEWLWDEGNGVPEKDEIKIQKFTIYNDMPFIVFAPFNCYNFLKEGAVCVVAPESYSYYICGWQDTLEGGNQTFNYMFLKHLIEKKKVGDALFFANMYKKIYSPQDTEKFKIYGDPSISLEIINNPDVGIIQINNKYIAPDTEFCPSCSIKNFSDISAKNLIIECQITTFNKDIVYNESKTIEKINQEEVEVKFPCWNDYEFGTEYNIKFEIISPKDNNKENDTLSTIIKTIGGDFLIIGKDTIVKDILIKLGYKGTQSDTLIFTQNFNTIFILEDTKGMDFLPQNLYIEGNNLWLSKFIEGDTIEGIKNQNTNFKIDGMGLSFSCSTMYRGKWFLPKNFTSIFNDSLENIISFYYQDDKYKIWCSRFKLTEIVEDTMNIKIAIIDSVMQFFGVKRSKEHEENKLENGNLFLECSPNPLYDKTFIKFKIKKYFPLINLTIYGINGRIIKRLYEGAVEPGDYEFIWDGKDDSGNKVVAGIYFIKLKSKEESKLLKLIVFK